MNDMTLFAELKRRNVFRVGIAYVVTSWLILQVADIVLDNTPAPDWIMQVIMLLMAIGLPVALLIAWAFELTAEGIKKEKDVDRSQSITNKTGRRLDRNIIIALVIALAYFAWDKFSTPDNAESPVIPASAGIQSEPGESDDLSTPQSIQDSKTVLTFPAKSIAVLPFVNLSSDPEQEFFSDGISEELLNVLAQFPGVHVAARTSSFQFKGKNQDIGEIARLLKVRNVLEGSVRKSGKRLRITAQLIEAETGYHLWSESYDRELDDVFAIQDEISAAIGEALRVELALGDEQKPAAPKVTESANTAAYEAFLQGRYLVNQRGRKNVNAAVEHLQRSVRLDPDYAPAHAWLAITTCLLAAGPSSYGDYTLEEITRRATPHIERALELDPELAEAHGAVALLALFTPDFELAMVETQRALELNPVYVDAMNWRQLAAQRYGDWEAAVKGMERIVEIDPLSIVGRLNYAGSIAISDIDAGRAMGRGLIEQNAWAGYSTLGNIEFVTAGDLSMGLRWLLLAYGEDPTDEFSNRNLIQIMAYVGLYEEARRFTERNPHLVEIEQGNLESALHSLSIQLESDPNNTFTMTELANVLHLAGQFDESLSYYLQLRSLTPGGVIFGATDYSTRTHLRMAYDFQLAGELEKAAQAITQYREDFSAKERANIIASFDYVSQAIARAIEGNEAGAMESIDIAIKRGFRQPSLFSEPALQSMQQNPGFLELKSELNHLLADERGEILQLICHDNPIPDVWQPMKKTCAGFEAGP
jgi:TolB-like protein/Flp pilus assembly protein TadD